MHGLSTRTPTAIREGHFKPTTPIKPTEAESCELNNYRPSLRSKAYVADAGKIYAIFNVTLTFTGASLMIKLELPRGEFHEGDP